jgi:predicted lipoprotein with Yx(FWY)xxD motif
MTTRSTLKSRSVLVCSLVAGALLLGAACSDSQSAATTTSAAPAPTNSTPADTAPVATGTATVILSDTSLGKVLTNAAGMTLYLFTPDSASASTCNAGCASNWPPVTGAAVGGDGLDATKFTTLTRDDGSTQVAYFGHPLYLYAGDAKAGDVTGQGVGGKWFAVTAAGAHAG